MLLTITYLAGVIIGYIAGYYYHKEMADIDKLIDRWDAALEKLKENHSD
jgi:hypothetical protein